MKDKPLIINDKKYSSRLIVGTGKYKNLEETKLAVEASSAEIITVAIRRTNMDKTKMKKTYSTMSVPKNIQYCLIQPDVIQRKMQLGHVILLQKY